MTAIQFVLTAMLCATVRRPNVNVRKTLKLCQTTVSVLRALPSISATLVKMMLVCICCLLAAVFPLSIYNLLHNESENEFQV